jgi:dipeptidyl aminopeptidase/acylaminoacyl peptidase
MMSSLHIGVLALCAVGAAPVPREQASNVVKIGGNFEVKVVKDIAYRDDKDADPVKHRLDLYLPKDHKNFPVLFFVHGGTWKSGDKKIYGPLGELFARNGIGVVITNYRLSPKVKHPAHIEDVTSAFAWTCANIKKHGGRANEVFVSGHSAGGHLVALLATDESHLKSCKLDFSNIKGVLALSGVYTILPKVFPSQFGNDSDVCRKASPLTHVKGKHAPFLIAYADNDYPTLGDLAEQMGKALLKAKCDASVLKMTGRDHISILVKMALGQEADPLCQKMLGFIATHSGLKLTPRKSK